MNKPLEKRIEVDSDVMKQAYGSSRDLLRVVNLSLNDAADMLQVISSFINKYYELFVTFRYDLFMILLLFLVHL